jgi:hypothetical protein
MGMFDYRPAVSSDAKACVELRVRTGENDISVSGLALLGITLESWGRSMEAGQLPGTVCNVEGQGIGKAPLSEVMQEVRKFGHELLYLGRSDNSAHRSFCVYRHLGWKATGLFDDNGDGVLEIRWPPAATN